MRYQGVYPGVDLVYYGTQGGELEYDFVVAPGANPKAIALGIEAQGKSPLRVDADGNLVVKLNGGDVQLHKPVIYQTDPAATASASRAKVEGTFALDAQNRVRFELGPYDHSRALVIDPVLSYATYLGGGGGDIGYAIAVDASLDAYIAGVTNSSNFPTAGGPYQQSPTKEMATPLWRNLMARAPIFSIPPILAARLRRRHSHCRKRWKHFYHGKHLFRGLPPGRAG